MAFYPPGTVVAASTGLVIHLGIATESGTVLANSKRKRCVCEETVAEFSEGRPIRVIGYLGALSPSDVLHRARSLIGRSYDLIRFNCEHFVVWAHGFTPRSSQVRTALVLGAAVAVALVLARR